LARDTDGTFYVGDWFNLRIRRISADGQVTTFAGSVRGAQDGFRTAATFDGPVDCALTKDGLLYISDWANGRIRKIDREGLVSTFASGITYIEATSVDDAGNVYATSRPKFGLYKYNPSGALVWSLNGGPGFRDGSAAEAQFEQFGKVLELADGNLLVMDVQRIRHVALGVPPLVAVTPPGGSFEDSVGVSLQTSASAVANAILRYTLDGSAPSSTSPRYSGPLTFTTTTTLQVRLFVNDNPISETVSATFTSASASKPPTITAQPQYQTTRVGGSASFVVSASGNGPLSYQWYLNGTPVAGATASTLSLENVQLNQQGTYTVAVSNAAGGVTSAGAVLTVTDPNVTGGTVTFSNLIGGINAPVFDVDGATRLAGAAFLAQFYAGPSAEALAPVGPAVPFRTGPAPGYWQAGTDKVRLIPTVPPGGTAFVQARVWESARGATFEQAVAAGGKFGSSAVLQLKTGGDGAPPSVPALMIGLQSLALTSQAAPTITQQPQSQTVDRGSRVTFRVGATGLPPLTYRWRFNGSDLAGVTADTLTVESAQPANVGAYSVVVTNPNGATISQEATLALNFFDDVPPVVTITTPAPGSTADERATFAGTITDNVGVVAARWERDGAVVGALPLNDGQFKATGLVLARGENRFKVIARDGAGNETAAEVLVTWAPARTFAVVNPPDTSEGQVLNVPIALDSQGDVGGVTFVLHYNPEYLREPEVSRLALDPNAFSQINTSVAGEIRASFALPGTAVPTGSHALANVAFRARSVPDDLTTELNLEVLDIGSPTGDPITFGTDVISGRATVLKRRLVGDNNSNGRLDVGDASVIIRLLTGQEQVRGWDIASNDLSQNARLDSGDVIRVFRVVVGLDPQPQPQAGERSGKNPLLKAAHVTRLAAEPAAALPLERAVLSLTARRPQPGELVTVQVRLQDIRTAILGASFALEYDTDAVRLLDAQSRRVGSLVPPGAVAVWNVMPAQTDFALQNGRVLLAAGSAIPWPASDGVLAEFTFQAQPGITAQHLWPITVKQIEISSQWLRQPPPPRRRRLSHGPRTAIACVRRGQRWAGRHGFLLRAARRAARGLRDRGFGRSQVVGAAADAPRSDRPIEPPRRSRRGQIPTLLPRPPSRVARLLAATVAVETFS
jgi:hypothetical protein